MFTIHIFYHKKKFESHFIPHSLLTYRMGVHCKVSCEVNLSKGRKYTADEKVKFTCEICSKSFNHKGNMQRHVKEVHYGKKRYDIGDTPIHHRKHNGKHNEKMGHQSVRDENKNIESVLNRVKIDFERKRELGKIAMEMIEKYELKDIPQELRNAIIFYLKMEGKD